MKSQIDPRNSGAFQPSKSLPNLASRFPGPLSPGGSEKSPTSRPIVRTRSSMASDLRRALRPSSPDSPARGMVSKKRFSMSAVDLKSGARNLAPLPLLVEKHRNLPRTSVSMPVRHFSSAAKKNVPKHPPVLAPLPKGNSLSGVQQDVPTDPRQYDVDANDTRTTKDKFYLGGPVEWSGLAEVPRAEDKPPEMTKPSQVTGIAESDTTFCFWSTCKMEDIRDRHKGFSLDEVDHMQEAFGRFLPPDATEVESSSLYHILIHLGYLGVSEKEVERISQEVCEFSTFSFDEVQQVAQKIASNERRLLIDTFEDLSNDMGKMNIQQLIEAMNALEMGPLKQTTLEILASACSGSQGIDGWVLDLDAFENFIAAYRVREGFTVSEIAKARQIYDDMACRSATLTCKCTLNIPDISRALLEMFGLFVANHIDAQCKALPTSGPCDNIWRSPSKQGVPFNEFLIWARRVRTLVINELWDEWEWVDIDDFGLVPMSRLNDVMLKLGFTLLRDSLDEFIDESGFDKDEKLDFDRFVTFVNTCRRHFGFSKRELEDFADVFAKFAVDKSGQIKIVPLLHLLRFLGYNTSLQEVQRAVDKINANGHGAIDFSEFLLLMRRRREIELKLVRRIFGQFSDGFDDHGQTLSQQGCERAFAALGEVDQLEGLYVRLLDFFEDCAEDVVHFWDFVVMVDKCRLLGVKQKRQRAGFSDKEFQKIRMCFEAHAKPGCNSLETGQFLWLVLEMGININCQDERSKIFSMLDDSRCAARDAGVEPDDIGEFGSQSITFWTIVHFLHLWKHKYEVSKVLRDEELIDETGFSRAEVTEFRQLFMEVVNPTSKTLGDEIGPDKSSSTSDRASQPGGRRRSMPTITTVDMEALQETSSGSRASSTNVVESDVCDDVLRLRQLRQLLSSIGLKLSEKQGKDLDEALAQFLDPKIPGVNFVTFLRVMRWMLDTNFADINGAAKRSLEKGPDKGRIAQRTNPKAAWTGQVAAPSADASEIGLPSGLVLSEPERPFVSKRRHSIA